MRYIEENFKIYEKYVRERYRVWAGRQIGLPGPWTDDPIIQNHKFTNNFRILDPGTQFIMTDLATDNPRDYLARCFLYRYTNLPSTWKIIRKELGRYPTVGDMNAELAQIISEYRDEGNTVFSGAYIIMPTPGKANADKVWEAVLLTRRFIESHMDTFFDAKTQEQRFNVLKSLDGVGNFMAMQILTDWGYGQYENPEDGFIVAGPGARRGAAFINPDASPEEVIKDLHERVWSRDPEIRLGEHPLSLMDIQNTLCEISKYARFMVKPMRKNPYVPAHPGEQPTPILPRWMA